MKKRIVILAVIYFAIVLLAYNGRSLGFDEASRGMAGAFYSDLFSGILGGKIGPGNFMAFAGNYHDHYKIVWDVLYFPPLQPLLMALSYALFGMSVRSSMLVNAAAGALILVLVYKTTRKIFGSATVLIPALLGFSPAFFFYASSAYYDVLLTFFYLGAFYLFLKYMDAPSGKNAFLLGLVIGAGFLAKYPAALALPAVLISLLIAGKPVLKSWPILAGFATLAVPWLAIQTNPAAGGKYFENWLLGGFNPAGSGAPGFSPSLVERAAYTIGTLVTDLSPLGALMVAVGIFFAFRYARAIMREKKIALACWTILYILVFAVLPTSHLEINRYRYMLPALPLLMVFVGSLHEGIGGRKALALLGVSFLALPLFVFPFETSQSHWAPAEAVGDYFLALSNSDSKAPIKVLVQDPTLAFALRERDQELRRFFVFYYPPTLQETEDLLADNSSSMSLKFFGLRSCGIGYATLINYGLTDEKPHPARQLVQDSQFNRLIKGKSGSSVEIYELLNVTECWQ